MIIHEPRLDLLSQLCHHLLYTLHPPLTTRESSNGITNVVSGNHIPVQYLIRKILEDAQQRLMFRAESFLRKEINRY